MLIVHVLSAKFGYAEVNIIFAYTDFKPAIHTLKTEMLNDKLINT